MAKKITALLLAAITMTIIFSGCDVIQETINAESQPSATVSQIDRQTWLADMESRPVPQMDGTENNRVTDFEENCLIFADYPSVSDKDTISSDIAALVQKKIDEFKQEVQRGQGITSEGEKPHLTITYEPFMLEDAVFSLKMVTDADSGVSRTNGFITTFAYDMKTEEKMALDDVFDSETDYAGTLSKLLRGKLEDNSALKSNFSAEMFESGTAATKSNFTNFTVGDGEVVFYFNANQIAPAAAGSFEAALTFDELQDVLSQKILNPDGRVTVNAATGEDIPSFLIGGEGDMSAFSIEGIDPEDKVVALTFDDGPNPSTTRQVLEALKKYNGVATFFLLGELADEYPEVVQEIYESGNEIGNHSYDHKDFKQISTEDMMDEVESTNQAIFDAVGARPILVRPPYGNVTDSIASNIGRACILWTVDPEDWKHRDEEIDYNNVMNYVGDGDIVLMHDIYQQTADAAERVIRDLTNQGYKLVTVSQMIQIAQARGQDVGLIVRDLRGGTD